jgi:DNA-nicking Smr family endonuclease
VDFGEILKLWDAQGRPDPRRGGNDQRGGGASQAQRGDGVEARRNPVAEAQERWLDRYGVPEPLPAARDEAPEPRLSRRDIEAMPIDAKVDLHGMTVREAEEALGRFFGEAERSGCRKVLIVHGKGLHSAAEPVLARAVGRWLERRVSAGRSGHAAAAEGGKGVTWVLLKKSGNQRSR